MGSIRDNSEIHRRLFAFSGSFTAQRMFEILRHEESDICRMGAIATVASQVSVLPSNGDALATHWLTATRHPQWSVFKPFIFCHNSRIDDVTVSAADAADEESRRHKLYVAHEKFTKLLVEKDAKAQCLLETLREMECKCLEDVEEMLSAVGCENQGKLAQIFQHMAQLEINFYSM